MICCYMTRLLYKRLGAGLSSPILVILHIAQRVAPISREHLV
jgi:hypothetical protein